jgi:hypothetical protein
MVHYTCDGCGADIERAALRYIVRIDARAAYDTLEIKLADLFRDHETELRALVEKMADRDPSELENEIYKQFELDLCPSCYRAYIGNPLRFHPEHSAAVDPPFDVDAFLRDLTESEEDNSSE